MPQSIDLPILLEFIPIAIIPCVDGIHTTAWNLSICDSGRTTKSSVVSAARCQRIRSHPLLYNLVAINGVHDIVVYALKHDGGNDACKVTHSIISQQPLLHGIWSTPLRYLQDTF